MPDRARGGVPPERRRLPRVRDDRRGRKAAPFALRRRQRHELRDGDLLLVDAGAEYRGYASDVTRTYAVGGTFTAEQALVYETVRRAGETAIAACRPGTEWHDVHRAAALVVAEGLVELGVLRGSPETLVESGAATLFFPHGVGHLGQHARPATPDASTKRANPARPAASARGHLAFKKRQAWTVEPGIYVVPALLARERGRDGVEWGRVDELHGFGGVRLEQNVLITEDGCESHPRSSPQRRAGRAGSSLWPLTLLA